MIVDNYELSISKSLLAYVLSQEGDLKALQLGREAVIHQHLAGLDVAEVELDRAKCMAVLAEKLVSKDKTEAEKLLSEALRIVQDMVVDEQNPAYEDFKREKARIRELLNKL
jgi:alpha-N-acetylglucosamine transferase